MTADIYAEWLRRQGHRIIRTGSTYWHSGGMGVFQAFPYHWLISPSESELADLFSSGRVVGARYSVPAENQRGCPSYAIVFEGEKYDFESVGHRTRKNIRRGLRNCTVQPISFQQLAEQGWEVRRDTLERQGRDLREKPELWKARYRAAADLSGLQAWGAFVGNRLAGYLVTFELEGHVCVIDQQSHREFLELNINNAITFVVTQTAISRPDIRSVFYGLESLDAPARVSEFKFHMGFVAKPIRQRVVFRPLVAPFANRLSFALVNAMYRVRPSYYLFSKARGMLEVYIKERQQHSSDGKTIAYKEYQETGD